MTLDEYNACRLPKKLSFKESEAALLVLVHDMPMKAAATVCGLRGKAGLAMVKAAVEMFQKAHQERAS
jgi:hypothetical protein